MGMSMSTTITENKKILFILIIGVIIVLGIYVNNYLKTGRGDDFTEFKNVDVVITDILVLSLNPITKEWEPDGDWISFRSNLKVKHDTLTVSSFNLLRGGMKIIETLKKPTFISNSPENEDGPHIISMYRGTDNILLYNIIVMDFLDPAIYDRIAIYTNNKAIVILIEKEKHK